MDKLLDYTPPTASNKVQIHLTSNQVTTIEGLEDDLDLRRIARAIRKDLQTPTKADEENELIKVKGDFRNAVRAWLVTNEVVTADRVVIARSATVAAPVIPTFNAPTAKKSKIHIRTQQQGKRWLTTVEGLGDEYDLGKIAADMKKCFHCSTSVAEEVVIIQGNHRDDVQEWLLGNEFVTEKEAAERLVVHGV